MGWYIAQVGKYKLSLHDSHFGYIRNSSKTMDYFKKRVVELEYDMVGNPNTIILKCKLTDFISIKCVKGRFTWEFKKMSPNWILYKKLFDIINENNIIIEAEIYTYVRSTSKDEFINFYLDSLLCSAYPIMLTSKKSDKKYHIDSYKTLRWIVDNGLHLKYK